MVLFIATLGFGVYVLWSYFPSDPIYYEPYTANISAVPSEYQFYPNMRYSDRVITYHIESACDDKKRENAQLAIDTIAERTILDFEESSEGQLRILCSEVAPEPEEEGHFIAGEGGPSEVINTSLYSVILSGKVSLYRDDKCHSPKIATHEILHALGFDHNNNKNSIMYPVTNCDQEIDEYITEEINRIYQADSEHDLGIEKVSANKTGRYFNFDITLGNYGLKNANNVVLSIYSDDELVKEFDLKELEIGTKKFLSVQNLRVSRDSGKVLFSVRSLSDSKELHYTNNNVSMSLN